MDGVVNLYKPAGVSSAKHAYRLRPIVGTRRVGHAGTLDPFAEGVLVVCLGRATRLVETIMHLPKTYRTTLRLGVTNASFDPEQPFQTVPVQTPPGLHQIQQTLSRFRGPIDQVPPAYSAIKLAGQPAYRLAARGRPTPLRARPVHIYRLELLHYRYPLLELLITCSRGTYIRALARDIGQALATGACCQSLTRTRVGPFRIEQALHLDRTQPQQLRQAVIPIEQARKLLQPPQQ